MEDAMSCEEFREAASAWFDGEGAEEAFEGITAHLSTCENCRLFVGGMPRQARLVRQLRDDPPGEPGYHPNREQFLEERGFFTSYIRAPLAAAAAIILVVMSLAVDHVLSNPDMGPRGDRSVAAPVARERVQR